MILLYCVAGERREGKSWFLVQLICCLNFICTVVLCKQWLLSGNCPDGGRSRALVLSV
jgi:hypothetical protein